MPLFLTLLISKLALKTSRLLGKGGGSALPGLIAEKLDSQILQKLGKNFEDGVVLVTGTNGKTTTTKMISEVLESSGVRVTTNPSGSNLTRGIISALINQASVFGHIEANMGLFEVDEASMPAASKALKPRLIVVLNLFRDQLDRYGELDKTASMIGRAIAEMDKGIVYLNADDPLVASLREYASGNVEVRYFGVEAAEVKKLAHDVASDSNHCPIDGVALKYTKEFFGHMGHYKCPNGDFGRPKTDVAIKSYAEGERITVSTSDQNIELKPALPGLYNAYNMLAAMASAEALGLDLVNTAKMLEKVAAAFGRVERVNIAGRDVYLLLIKNPTGFNQVIQTFLLAKPSSVMIAINDNFADGRDVSWLWDVGFEELTNQGHKIVTSGIRAADMALRLKYAGIEASLEEDLAKALEMAVAKADEGEKVYVLPTYTAMFALRRLIAQKTELKGFWQ